MAFAYMYELVDLLPERGSPAVGGGLSDELDVHRTARRAERLLPLGEPRQRPRIVGEEALGQEAQPHRNGESGRRSLQRRKLESRAEAAGGHILHRLHWEAWSGRIEQAPRPPPPSLGR
eukprot:6379665-Prymnesium_polylepis.1